MLIKNKGIVKIVLRAEERSREIRDKGKRKYQNWELLDLWIIGLI